MPVNYSTNDLNTTGNVTASSCTFTNSSIGVGTIVDANNVSFGIYQEDFGRNILVGSLEVYNGLSSPTVIYTPMPALTPGYFGGNIPIGYDINKQIQKWRIGSSYWDSQTGGLVPGNVNFVLGDSWPTGNAPYQQFLYFNGLSVDVLLELTVATDCTVIWDIVDDWYNQPPPAFNENTKHLVLLRSFGTQFVSHQSEPGAMPNITPLPIIQGHYIGQKTN